MANKINTEYVNAATPTPRNDLDMSGITFARQNHAMTGVVGKQAKLKNFKVTNSGTPGTTTAVTLPTDTYHITMYSVTANAAVGFAFGTDTPAMSTSTTSAVGGVFLTAAGSGRVEVVVPEDQTTLTLVSDTASAVVWISCVIA